MGWELSYETYISHVGSNELESRILDLEEYKRKIENEILATMLMDPSKLRNQRNRSKIDFDYDEDSSHLNNAQYIVKIWEELHEEYEDTISKLARYRDALEAIRQNTRKIVICPDCLKELDFSTEEDENGYRTSVLKCPKCGKKYSSEYNPTSRHPTAPTAEIKTWSEG